MAVVQHRESCQPAPLVPPEELQFSWRRPERRIVFYFARAFSLCVVVCVLWLRESRDSLTIDFCAPQFSCLENFIWRYIIFL